MKIVKISIIVKLLFSYVYMVTGVVFGKIVQNCEMLKVYDDHSPGGRNCDREVDKSSGVYLDAFLPYNFNYGGDIISLESFLSNCNGFYSIVCPHC